MKCCRADGSLRCQAGWVNASCEELSIFPAVVYCDTIFTGFAAPPTNGVGDGYAPAFDRAIPIGTAVPANTSHPETSIVIGYYPAPDVFVAGSYSTRIFAIQAAPAGQGANRYAAIDIVHQGLDPTADGCITTCVLAGEAITGPFDMEPSGLVGTGDVTIVVQTYRSNNPIVVMDTRLTSIDLASLTFVDALPLPPMCLGDADRSGAVSFADVTAVLANFSQHYEIGVMMPGDANGDRTVNFSDVTTILANFGNSCGTPAP